MLDDTADHRSADARHDADPMPDWLAGALHGLPDSGEAPGARAWDAVGDLASSPEIMALRRAALGEVAQARGVRARRTTRRAAWGGAIAATLALFATFAALRPDGAVPPQFYEASPGARTMVTLTDGSRILLDRNSRVSVAYSDKARRIDLLRGQAEFEVAKDHARPFSVYGLGGQRVVATGTVFDVDILDSRMAVSLLRGSVVVSADANDAIVPQGVRLRPSEQLVIDHPGAVARKGPLDGADAQAWKSGKLIFDVEPLGRAVARVNRYSARKLTLSAGKDAASPISGVFNVGDIDGFAEAVSAQLPLRVVAHRGDVTLAPL